MGPTSRPFCRWSFLGPCCAFLFSLSAEVRRTGFGCASTYRIVGEGFGVLGS